MISKEMVLNELAKKINVPIDAIYAAQLNVSLKMLHKGEIFVRVGERSDNVGFIIDGIVRNYALSSEGQEVTTYLAFSGSFVAPYADQLIDRPSNVHIEMLEKTVIAIFSFAQLRELVINDPVWTIAGLKIAETLYLEKSERERILLSMSAKEKLENFIEQHPAKWKKISKGTIASFLGINPSTLSRIKSKLLD
jgi:CRP-like cAMP-binding protein